MWLKNEWLQLQRTLCWRAWSVEFLLLWLFNFPALVYLAQKQLKHLHQQRNPGLISHLRWLVQKNKQKKTRESNREEVSKSLVSNIVASNHILMDTLDNVTVILSTCSGVEERFQLSWPDWWLVNGSSGAERVRVSYTYQCSWICGHLPLDLQPGVISRRYRKYRKELRSRHLWQIISHTLFMSHKF